MLELFQSQIFGDRQHFLTGVERAQDLGLVADRNDTVIGVGRGQQVFGVGDDVTARFWSVGKVLISLRADNLRV